MESYVNIILLYIQLLIFDKTREEFIAFNNMYKSNFKITIFLCHNFYMANHKWLSFSHGLTIFLYHLGGHLVHHDVPLMWYTLW